MSETTNIAALAALASENIFAAFNWRLLEVADENFPCDKVEKHQTKGAGSKHPVDCVFSYSDPFSNKTIFLLFDLKSYAASTIAKTDFAPYIRTLSKCIDCAAVSRVWKERYVSAEITDWLVEGLLFVYNNDNEYDSNFKEKARGLSPASLPHNRTLRVHLLDPEGVSYLQSVVKDMKSMCGENELDYAQRRFFYPHQLINTPGEGRMPVATIEMLRGRVIVVVFPERMLKTPRYIVYLRGDGTVQDFEYIITYLYRNGVMELAETVTVKGISFSGDAQSHFMTAKQNFLLRHYRMKEIKASLDRIAFGRVDRVQNSFSTTDAAMARKK